MLLKLDKVPHGDLGLSLASNHDRDRNQMIVLVVAVKSTCLLSVKIGDELLEVYFCNKSKGFRDCIEENVDRINFMKFENLVEKKTQEKCMEKEERKRV